jgi:predicted DNA-binding transcriptional regulator AlpA
VLVVQDLLTTKEVAAKLGVNPRTVEALGFPRIKLGHRTVRYAASDVNALLESCRGGLE